MKIISNVHKVLFFKTTDLHNMDIKIWKKHFKLISKKNIWICRQLKYYQLRRRSEIGILLEIILNALKCLTVSLSTETLFLDKASLLFISVCILYELQSCQVCTFYCPLSKKTCTLLPEGTDVHTRKHIHQKDWILYLSLY